MTASEPSAASLARRVDKIVAITDPETVEAPVGMCVVTEFYDAATDTKRLRIDQADQSIEITDELLAALAARGWVDGELFRIEAENGSVTYALNGRHPFYPDCWRAERRTPWPLSERGESRV